MSRTGGIIASAVCIMLGASLATADAQTRGGGGGGGGERRAAPRAGASRPAPPRTGGTTSGRPYYYGGRPYYGARGSYVFVGGYFYDPFFGPYPWWSHSAYGYGGYYPIFDDRADVRIQATPRDAAVYVDGFYAGVVDDFDGVFQRLPLTPGGHRIELYMDGFRTVQRNLYLQRGTTMKMHETLAPLAAGQSSERPELAPPVPPPPDGSFTEPRGGTTRGLPPPLEPRVRTGGRDGRDDGRDDGRNRDGRDGRDRDERGTRARGSAAQGFGTLVLHVQPSEAEVSVDGQRWLTSGAGDFELQLPAGRHRVEVELQGFERFTSEIDVRAGGPTSLNVSLSRGR